MKRHYPRPNPTSQSAIKASSQRTNQLAKPTGANHRIGKYPLSLAVLLFSSFVAAIGASALISASASAQTQQPDRSIAQTTPPTAEPILVPVPDPASVPPPLPIVSVTVNSDLDGPVTPDAFLTLREAIEVVNGTLPLTALSAAESALVAPAPSPAIAFALLGDTRIELTELLPAIAAANLTIDGTTQPGYGQPSDQPAAVPVLTPAVSITPAAGAEVFRGFTISANEVTVRGLSLYGFSSTHANTETTPPADIFITHLAPPPGTNTGAAKGPNSPSATDLHLKPEEYDEAPRGVVIEDNWLGTSPAGGIPVAEEMSAFGVSVFNATDAVIQRNRIEFHEGSGIITGALAEGLIVTENTLIGNGLRGMPDAIRLDGNIDRSEIFGNLLCANDGSGLYMFKPQGSSRIYANDVRFNGRRLRRPGIYLMGSGHEVTDNYIAFQPGPGVAIAAHPKSTQNTVRTNTFRRLDGLSLDLVYHEDTQVSDYQFGDGPNPPRNSNQRRKDSANSGINAPEFDAYVFPTNGANVLVTGKADAGSDVDIYQVDNKQRIYGELGELITTVSASEDGTFSTTLEMPEGMQISAIATDARYGSSEPSPVAAVGSEPPANPRQPYQPVCQDPPPPEPIVPKVDETPITIRIPRNIHFALDRSFISAESANILDQIAQALETYPSLTIELQGHTDPRASNAYNDALGERRALSARDYLLQKGIAPERMRIRSFGESQLISNAPDIVDYARDRRVEFEFFDSRGLDIIYENLEIDLQIE